MLSITALKNLDIFSVDVQTAYLYGVLKEEIYIEQPQKFAIKGKEKMV